MKVNGYIIKQKGCHVTISKDGRQVYYTKVERKLTKKELEIAVVYFLNCRAWGD